MTRAWPTLLLSVAAGVGLYLWADRFTTLAAAVLGLVGLAAVAFVVSRVLLDRAAASIVRQVQVPLLAPHTFRSSTLAAHPTLDAAAYEGATAALVALGFRHLGDVEDLTVSALNPRLQTLTRWLARDDGTVAELFAVDVSAQRDRAPSLPVRRLLVALRTELSPGGLVTTANAGELRTLPPPPTTDAQGLPWATAPAELVAAHDARLAAHRQRGAQPAARLASTDDVIAHVERLRHAERAWREGRGWLTEADLLHLAGPKALEQARAVWPYVKARLAPAPRVP